MPPTDSLEPGKEPGDPRDVQWRCPQCLQANRGRPAAPGTGPWTCSGCGAKQPDRPNSLNPEGEIIACPVCGCPDVYRQRDFNRKLGVGIVIAGAVLAPFTKFISLIVCALIDFAIYLRIRDIVVCYHCRAIFGGYSGMDKVKPYDLNTSDKYIEIERKRGW